MFKKFTNGCVRVVNRWLPDPFLFAVILSIIVYVFAMIATKMGPLKVLNAWGSTSGFWGLLAFSMQMALVLVFGSAMASAKPCKKALRFVAGMCHNNMQAIVVTTFISTMQHYMLASVLSRHFCTLKTRANLNNHIGTPQTLLELEPRHQAAVIETGLDHFGQIRYMGSLVQPTIAVITNVGDAHIENLGGTRQGILQAKCEIFDHLRPGGLAVLCGDDPLLNGLTLPFETLRCGKGESCNVRVTDIVRRGIDGLDCTVTTSRRSYRLSIPSPGDYMIYPASMAAAIGEYLGLSEQEIVEGVAAYVSTGSRMRRIRLPEDRLIIDDCYNANPQAMEAALEILADTACRRRVAVLGDMGELGPISHDAHLEVGRVTARLGLDAVIAIGPKSAAIAETAGPRALHFDTVQQALPALREQLTPGTAMLVKASHAMEFGKIVNELESTTYDRHQCDRSGQIL